ncbi:hypothetical protein HK405_003886 [Cladochytrium tenue]|nr:hypothetical protein HK405_003886 [Cladochytrium tenue]
MLVEADHDFVEEADGCLDPPPPLVAQAGTGSAGRQRRRRPGGSSCSRRVNNCGDLQLAIALSRSLLAAHKPAVPTPRAPRAKARKPKAPKTDSTPVLLGESLQQSLDDRATAFIDLSRRLRDGSGLDGFPAAASLEHTPEPCTLWEYASSACKESDACSRTHMIVLVQSGELNLVAPSTMALTLKKKQGPLAAPLSPYPIPLATLSKHKPRIYYLTNSYILSQPLDLQEFCNQLKKDMIKCSQKEVVDFLDGRAIAYCLA